MMLHRTPVATSGVVTVHPVRPRRPQSPQRIWRRASAVTDPLDHHDVLAVVLELLRAAQHDASTVSRALTLGRTCARERPRDVGVERGVLFLEQALTFMGAELPEEESA